MKKILLAIGFSLILTSCTQRLFDFTIISTKNIEISKLASLQKMDKRVEGEDVAHLIIIVPTNTIRIDQAIDNTIESVPGCLALMDGVVYSKFWYIPYVYGQTKYVVEATPLIDPSLSLTPSIPKFGKVELDKNGKVKAIRPITEEEYYSEKEKIMVDSERKMRSYPQ